MFFLCTIAMCELGVESVETLFLALPENLQGEDNLKVLKGFWEVSESVYSQDIYSVEKSCLFKDKFHNALHLSLLFTAPPPPPKKMLCEVF